VGEYSKSFVLRFAQQQPTTNYPTKAIFATALQIPKITS
jgi:hypothetical protein